MNTQVFLLPTEACILNLFVERCFTPLFLNTDWEALSSHTQVNHCAIQNVVELPKILRQGQYPLCTALKSYQLQAEHLCSRMKDEWVAKKMQLL